MDLKPKNIHFKERVLNHLAKQNFMHHIEFTMNTIEPGFTEGRMKLKPIHLQQDGFTHGGVITTIADIVAGFAAYTLVGAEEHVVTGEIKISFFKKGVGDSLKAVGSVIKPGKRMNFCEAEVFSVSENNFLAITSSSNDLLSKGQALKHTSQLDRQSSTLCFASNFP